MNKRRRQEKKIRIVSRIFLPEAAAAALRLGAVAKACASFAQVEVITARPNKTYADTGKDKTEAKYTVKTWPVHRNKDGYVKGYLSYLSFDVPIFFRYLFAKKADITLVEPPPTTGFVMRIASFLRRSKYVWYAPDIWYKAAEAVASGPAVKVVKFIEGFAMRGAQTVIAINEEVARCAKELGAKQVVIIPNGVDTELFTPEGENITEQERKNIGIGNAPFLLYAGTASNWQGADIFIRALSQVREQTLYHLVFIGRGDQWQNLYALVQQLKLEERVHFLPTVSAEKAASWTRSARAALVSIKTGIGYDFAYPTKIFAALSCGTPVIYAGANAQVICDIREYKLGYGTKYEVSEVAKAILTLENTKDKISAVSTINKSTATAVSVGATAQLRNWVVQNRSVANTGFQVASLIKQYL